MTAKDLVLWLIVILTSGGAVVGCIAILSGIISISTDVFIQGSLILIVSTVAGSIAKRLSD